MNQAIAVNRYATAGSVPPTIAINAELGSGRPRRNGGAETRNADPMTYAITQCTTARTREDGTSFGKRTTTQRARSAPPIMIESWNICGVTDIGGSSAVNGSGFSYRSSSSPHPRLGRAGRTVSISDDSDVHSLGDDSS